MGSTPTWARSVHGQKVASWTSIPSDLSWPGRLALHGKMVAMRGTQLLTNSIYGVFSVVVCTPFCEIGSMGSFPIRHPKHVTLADVVIAPVWSTEEVGSIPTGYTNAPVDKLAKSSLSKGEI